MLPKASQLVSDAKGSGDVESRKAPTCFVLGVLKVLWVEGGFDRAKSLCHYRKTEINTRGMKRKKDGRRDLRQGL